MTNNIPLREEEEEDREQVKNLYQVKNQEKELGLYQDPKTLFEQEFTCRILDDPEWSAWTDTLTEEEWDQYMDLALVFAGLKKPPQPRSVSNLKYRVKRGQRRRYKEFCHE